MTRQRLSAEDRHVALLACAAFLIEELGLSAHNAASLLNPAAIGTKRQSLERRFAGPRRRAARIAAIAAGRALALAPAESEVEEGRALTPEHAEQHAAVSTGAVLPELAAEWRAEVARQRRNELLATVTAAAIAEGGEQTAVTHASHELETSAHASEEGPKDSRKRQR